MVIINVLHLNNIPGCASNAFVKLDSDFESDIWNLGSRALQVSRRVLTAFSDGCKRRLTSSG